MILQPISSRLPNFLNKLIPENQEKDQRRWWEILSGLQENLRYVANYLFKVTKSTTGPYTYLPNKFNIKFTDTFCGSTFFSYFNIFTSKCFYSEVYGIKTQLTKGAFTNYVYKGRWVLR